MSDPQYGTQIVRFAETAQVADDKEVDQFRVCQWVGTDNPTKITTTFKKGDVEGTNANPASLKPAENPDVTFKKVLGVTQQRLREVNDTSKLSEQNASDNLRLISVATSGLLLIEQTDTKENRLTPGDYLSIDSEGKASKEEASGGTNFKNRLNSALVSINGTTPEVRSIISYGKKHYALVYFS